jgi:hypothetical protein
MIEQDGDLLLCYLRCPLLFLVQLLRENRNELLAMCPSHSTADPAYSNKLKLVAKEIFLRLKDC